MKPAMAVPPTRIFQHGFGLILAVVFGLLAGFLAPAFCQQALADQTDPRLPSLFAQLKASHSKPQARQLESQIWTIWTSHTDQMINHKMQQGIAHMQQGNLGAAERLFSAVIATDPSFAEGWNKRATIRFFRGDDAGSQQDIASVMRLEPRHFGALSGLGMIHMRAGNHAAALTAYQAAQQINPHLVKISELIDQLSAKLRGRGI
jgi:Tfp pilus assembly protein PilF